MFLNIITPCSRPENLLKISESINIPTEKYRWIIVFDLDELPDEKLIPKNCEYYLHRNNLSIVGHSQRNFALEIITDGYVYFNDDDTLIHPNLWESINNLSEDFISFKQLHKNGTLRLMGDVIEVGHIDSHNFMVKREVINNTRFNVTKYDADGYFAKECFMKSNSKKWLDLELSIYNQLR
jgi:hypothetical protein